MQRGCAFGLHAGHAGRASARPTAAPCCPAVAWHHEPRRGSACRASPRLVHPRSAAAAATMGTWAASASSTSTGEIALPCHSSPEQHGERGMANDEQMGRGVACECGRAHQIRHCHQRGQRSPIGRRRRPQLDAVRQPCAALLVTLCCDPSFSRVRSTFADRIEVVQAPQCGACTTSARRAESDARETELLAKS